MIVYHDSIVCWYVLTFLFVSHTMLWLVVIELHCSLFPMVFILFGCRQENATLERRTRAILQDLEKGVNEGLEVSVYVYVYVYV